MSMMGKLKPTPPAYFTSLGMRPNQTLGLAYCAELLLLI